MPGYNFKKGFCTLACCKTAKTSVEVLIVLYGKKLYWVLHGLIFSQGVIVTFFEKNCQCKQVEATPEKWPVMTKGNRLFSWVAKHTEITARPDLTGIYIYNTLKLIFLFYCLIFMMWLLVSLNYIYYPVCSCLQAPLYFL